MSLFSFLFRRTTAAPEPVSPPLPTPAPVPRPSPAQAGTAPIPSEMVLIQFIDVKPSNLEWLSLQQVYNLEQNIEPDPQHAPGYIMRTPIAAQKLRRLLDSADGAGQRLVMVVTYQDGDVYDVTTGGAGWRMAKRRGV